MSADPGFFSAAGGPILGSAANLIGGLFNIAAQRAAEKRKALAVAANTEAEAGVSAAKSMTEGQRNAFGDLMGAWKTALVN